MDIQAIRLNDAGGVEQMQLQQLTLSAPAAGEVQVQHHAIGVNYIDIYFRTGLYPAPSKPYGLGFEAAGVVTAVGGEVKHLKVGDRVAYCQGPLGAYATAKNHPASQVVKIPDGISFETAAAMMLKGLTVQYLFRQTYALKAGETVLFHAAAGGVGLIACQWARALGVQLIGTVSTDEKAHIAKAHGAWATINSKTENIAARVAELTGGAKCPVVYDGVGKDTWEASLDSLQPRGLMVSFGNASGAVTGVNLQILAAKGSLFVTRPTLGTHTNTLPKLQAMSDELFDLVLSGKIKIDIHRRHALKDCAQAHTDLASRNTVGASILLP